MKTIKKKRDDAAKAIEDAKITEKEAGEAKAKEEEGQKAKAKEEEDKKAAADKDAKDKEANDPKNAKAGQVWKTKNGNEVEILHLTKQLDKKGEEKDDLADGYIFIKGKSGKTDAIRRDNIASLVKDVEEKAK